MTFLKDTSHDVFVSYAHIDNESEREGEKGWVECFARDLSIRLLKRFGEQVDVWRDPELGRAQVFDAVIENAVRQSGVMVSLITPRYLKSEYCKQEISWFREKAEKEPAGLRVGDYVRIFPVLLYNIPPAEWPEVCRGTSGFRMHDGEGHKFGSPLDPDSEAFEARMKDLVEELHAVITKLAGASGSKPPTPRGDGFRVFLASSSEDQNPARRQLAKALAKDGIEVISELPPPYDKDEHEKAVSDALQTVDLSVHLLGATAGEPIDVDRPEARTYPLEQADLARKKASSQLVLTPASLTPALIDDPAYAEFLKGLIEQERDGDRFQLVSIDRHRMLDAILLRKQAIEDARRRRTDAASPGGTAFVDLHMNDLRYATDLVSYLGSKRFTPLMVPSSDQSPTMGMFEENLRKSRLFLVVFGDVPRNWVTNRLIEANKLVLVNGWNTRIGVYVAPPGKPKEAVSFPCDVALNTDRFDPATLDPILAKVEAVLA